MIRVALVCWLAAVALQAQTLPAQTLDQCRGFKHHGKLPEAQACFARLAAGSNAYARAEGLWALERYQDANDEFKALVKQEPKNALYRVRWGYLFLERFNPNEAGNLFNEALEIDKDNAQAYLGLARVAAENYGGKAVEFAEKAAKLDPKLAEPHELLAFLALEDNDEQRAAKEADQALGISAEALDAMAIHATIDWLDDKAEAPHLENPWIDKVLKVNPAYGEAYATAGHFFVLNRRYTEGIKFYRKALDLNPRLWNARAELGVNLMRLGQEGEARQQLEQCYNAEYRSAETVNTLRLLDSYANFNIYETNRTILRVAKKESDLLRPYFESEMQRAIATYEKKYQLKLNGPVQVEVYPDHEDFAVRTMGMPGLGALGVTFGSVVAMDSPSGRPPGSFHWASTMWHELSHVYVLQATNHRVPRWFTEGMAVYEETAAAPDWGDRLDPEAINAIQKKLLLPVAELDRGFVRPSYPSQVIVSYFQAGKICSYIAEKWSYSKLLDMMHEYAKLKTTPEIFHDVLGMSTEDFDKQFLAWLGAETKNPVEHFEEWRKQIKTMVEDLRAKKYDDVIREGKVIGDYYPDYVEAGSVYELMADAYTAKEDKASARKELEQYNQVGGRSPLLIKRLATLEEQAGDPKKAAAVLDRLNYIYPEDQELHKRLGDLWLAQNNLPGAIREYQAVLATKPLDQAAAHFQLASALQKANRIDEAREQVLLSLEAAPGYKPAQRLLLEVSK
ncbi:MAG TPA: tetratricopeptide repeat protein [Bryobacteraceae bacterium]|nr:tetratricopeptide repeat protein [Bryobacteraceae bacterium]